MKDEAPVLSAMIQSTTNDMWLKIHHRIDELKREIENLKQRVWELEMQTKK